MATTGDEVKKYLKKKQKRLQHEYKALGGGVDASCTGPGCSPVQNLMKFKGKKRKLVPVEKKAVDDVIVIKKEQPEAQQVTGEVATYEQKEPVETNKGETIMETSELEKKYNLKGQKTVGQQMVDEGESLKGYKKKKKFGY